MGIDEPGACSIQNLGIERWMRSVRSKHRDAVSCAAPEARAVWREPPTIGGNRRDAAKDEAERQRSVVHPKHVFRGRYRVKM